LRISAPGKAKEAEFLVVLAPLAEGEQAPEVAMEGRVVKVGGDALRFAGDGKTAPTRAGR
jgi:hypothetical protein